MWKWIFRLSADPNRWKRVTALNLNIHFRMLFLDGVYVMGTQGARARFHRVDEPTNAELTPRVHKIAHRVGLYLGRQGWLERDAENAYLALDTADEDSLSVLQGHSISYRIAVGPQAERRVFTLQTLPPVDRDEAHSGTVGQVAAFNLHTGVLLGPINDASWSVYAVTSPDPRFRSNACH